MAVGELVSIVTPTIVGREDQLLNRCVASVMRQDWAGEVEQVIVSDRNPGEFGDGEHNYRIGGFRLRAVEINETWRTPEAEACTGSVPWQIGCRLALGEFVGFCGDDDELLPDHITRHIAAMREHEAMFSISAVEFRVDGQHRMVVGPSFGHGNLDAIGIMCHVDALKVSCWPVTTDEHANAGDYRLVRDWQAAGLRGVLVPGGPTAVHHDGWLAGKSGRPDRPGGGYTP